MKVFKFQRKSRETQTSSATFGANDAAQLNLSCQIYYAGSEQNWDLAEPSTYEPTKSLAKNLSTNSAVSLRFTLYSVKMDNSIYILAKQ